MAVVKTLFDHPLVQEADPNAEAGLRYEVPTPLVQIKSAAPRSV